MNPPVVFRKAIPADAHYISAVRADSWQQAYRGIIPDAYLDALRPFQDEAHWLESITSDRLRIIVGEVNGHVVGC